ncbi:MAG: flippase [Lachnospiraceae bacterium]|nr:flippase [Lachnospiraceae bacterium]
MRKNAPSVKKNYIYSLSFQILSMITPFITAPYIARVLGADGVGIYSYTQSYMTYFTMFASLGTAAYGMREIAQCRDDREQYSKTFWEIELLTVFTTAICLLIWSGMLLFTHEYRIYFIALIPSLLAVMFDISWFYTGHEKIGYTVFWNAVCKILGIVLIFCFVKKKEDLFLYILINATMTLLGNMSMWVFLPKMLVRVSLKSLRFRNHFKETLIYFIPTIATSIYTVLDKTLIGAITHNQYQNGYYEQATKIINMAKTAVFVSINSVMGARISYLFVENKMDEIKERIRKSMDFILLLGIGAMFGIIGVARLFVPIFFGKGYEEVIYLLYWMAPLIVIIGVSNCLGSQYYTPAGLRGRSAKYIIAGSCVNLIMNLICIPHFGATGAVIGSILAELTITVLYFVNCAGVIVFNDICRMGYKKLIAGMVMAIVVYWIGNDNISIPLLMLQIVVGAAVYLLILLLWRDAILSELIMMIKGRVKNG